MTDADADTDPGSAVTRLREARKQLRLAAADREELEHECRDLAGRVGELLARLEGVQTIESDGGER